MLVKSTVIFLAFFVASSFATDCNGVDDCSAGLPNALDNLISIMKSLNGSRVFKDKEYIACTDPIGESSYLGYCDGICAYFKSPNYPGRNTGIWAKTLIGKIRSNGCAACGNIPLSYENNDSSKGVLTVNFVRDPCMCGLNQVCPPGVIQFKDPK